MRRLPFSLSAFAATQAFALGFSQKDTLTNTRYQESPEEVAAREFKEHKAELPPLPDTQSGDWFRPLCQRNLRQAAQNPA